METTNLPNLEPVGWGDFSGWLKNLDEGEYALAIGENSKSNTF